ncbi:hypothetical protein [Methylophaga muralis]|uniref:HEPN AbiU2-like domain-containing protein n=1 Tax=Methylophaga muralis TaxID=291169 RepID=A0A1E3GTS3_9GAMM|nr:hypothetical protein [Methylophaga muralis]ODN67404.1 hypothetical protein A9E74_00938 [Methylophaga muralis]
MNQINLTEAQLDRVIYSLWDFQQALSALTFLLEECEYKEKYSRVELRRFKCFEATAIISFARPFVTSRGKTTLGLNSLGIQLSKKQKELRDKLIYIRKTIVAHSDEEEMHFRSHTFDISDFDAKMAHFQFDEGLHLSEADVWKFVELLHFLKDGIFKRLFNLAQHQPEMLNKYKQPTK